ncbi:hypothetical protein HUU42_03360 [bacterium]|nr:hypothetical protein [bacterium]
MGQMKAYLIEKLSGINYRMTVHEGDAKRRLAVEAANIFLLPKHEIPVEYEKQFQGLLDLIEASMPFNGLTPTNLKGLRNPPAVKYIKLLLDIQSELKNNEND